MLQQGQLLLGIEAGKRSPDFKRQGTRFRCWLRPVAGSGSGLNHGRLPLHLGELHRLGSKERQALELELERIDAHQGVRVESLALDQQIIGCIHREQLHPHGRVELQRGEQG